jgi:hypothetical protein
MPALAPQVTEEEGMDPTSGVDLRRAVGRALNQVEKVTNAEAFARLLRALQPDRSPSDSGTSSGAVKALSDVLSGLGSAFKGLGEGWKSLLETLVSTVGTGKDRGNGGTDQTMALVVAVLGLLVPLITQQNEDSTKRWQAVVDGRDQYWREIVTQLRQELERRSGPSQYDQIAHGMVTSMFERVMRDATAPPKDRLQELRDSLGLVRELRQTLDGIAPAQEYSEGALRYKELSLREQSELHKHRVDLERARASRAWAHTLLRGGPAMVSEILRGALNAFGFGVPEDSAIAAGLGSPAPGGPPA